MSYNTTLSHISYAVVDWVVDMVAAILEQTHDIRELFYQLVSNDTLLMNELEISNREHVSPRIFHITPRKRLPPTLRSISESRKSVIRAAHAQDMDTFCPGSSQLPRAQRSLTAPITLSGPDAAVNVALRPMAAHISLGHEYRSSPAPCPTPVPSTYINPQADILTTLRGATRALDALMHGTVDEKWLEAPGDEPQPVSAPRMTRSYAQWSPMEAPKMVRSYARTGKAFGSRRSVDSSKSGLYERTPKEGASRTETVGEEKE